MVNGVSGNPGKRLRELTSIAGYSDRERSSMAAASMSSVPGGLGDGVGLAGGSESGRWIARWNWGAGRNHSGSARGVQSIHNTKRRVGARLATCDGKGRSRSREKTKTQGSEWWWGGRCEGGGRRVLNLRGGTLASVLGAGCSLRHHRPGACNWQWTVDVTGIERVARRPASRRGSFSGFTSRAVRCPVAGCIGLGRPTWVLGKHPQQILAVGRLAAR